MNAKDTMDATKYPKVFVILLNWNGWEDTVECISSLKGLEYPELETVVVDNNSQDDSVQELNSRFPEVTLIENDENKGFPGGNNVGIRYALANEADYVWLLNNDTVAEGGSLRSLVDKMEGDPSIGICGSKLVYYHQDDTLQALGGGRYNPWIGIGTQIGQQQPVEMEFNVEEIEKDLDYIIGASVMASRSFLDDIGLLSEDYFFCGEELDWAVRAKGRYRLGFAGGSTVYHKEGASAGATSLEKDNKSRLSDYYTIKSRLKGTWKHYPWHLPFVYIGCLYSILNRIRRRQWDRIPMILNLFFTFNDDRRYEDYKS